MLGQNFSFKDILRGILSTNNKLSVCLQRLKVSFSSFSVLYRRAREKKTFGLNELNSNVQTSQHTGAHIIYGIPIAFMTGVALPNFHKNQVTYFPLPTLSLHLPPTAMQPVCHRTDTVTQPHYNLDIPVWMFLSLCTCVCDREI